MLACHLVPRPRVRTMLKYVESESKVDQTVSLDTGSWQPEPGPGLAVEAAGRTDRGRVRDNNEDQFLIAELEKLLRVEQSSLSEPAEQAGRLRGHLLLVADGMRGYVGGELASRLA